MRCPARHTFAARQCVPGYAWLRLQPGKAWRRSTRAQRVSATVGRGVPSMHPDREPAGLRLITSSNKTVRSWVWSLLMPPTITSLCGPKSCSLGTGPSHASEQWPGYWEFSTRGDSSWCTIQVWLHKSLCTYAHKDICNHIAHMPPNFKLECFWNANQSKMLPNPRVFAELCRSHSLTYPNTIIKLSSLFFIVLCAFCVPLQAWI